jgi:tRNA G37 N-methylase Trm5
MPHPFKAHRYLTPARKLTKDNGVIHYYRHITAKNGDYAEMIMREEVRSILGEEPEVSVRKVKEIGPRYLEMVADISFYHSNNLERQLLAVSI